MRAKLLALFLFAVATSAAAKDVYLSIGGSVGVFRTDMRVFNPSATKDIQVQAYMLPVGNNDNSGAQPTLISIPKRSQVVYDDVVASLFQSSGLAAIRLKSDDDFVATQRIYAASSSGCIGTLGQFVPALDTTQAKKQGVLIQLKSNALFRTNMGVVNPNNGTANVTWRLYDKNNALVGTPRTDVMPRFAVISPQNIAGYLNAGNADLTDAWISFVSDQPIFAYASVVDNGTTDPTFIPFSEDTGAAVVTPVTTGKVFNFSLRSGVISVTPELSINPGESATFRITATEPLHGFEVTGPEGTIIVQPMTLQSSVTVERTVTFSDEGTYTYFCTQPTCSTGHNSMIGTFVVGKPTPEPKPSY